MRVPFQKETWLDIHRDSSNSRDGNSSRGMNDSRNSFGFSGTIKASLIIYARIQNSALQ
jgi:hypothetical protein